MIGEGTEAVTMLAIEKEKGENLIDMPTFKNNNKRRRRRRE